MRPGIMMLLVIFFLSGCANGEHAISTRSNNPGNTSTKVTDCGARTTTYTKIPQRVVAMDGSAAEMLLALGVGSHIVAVGYPNPEAQIPATLLPAFKKIPTTFKEYPDKESLVAQQPDLVISILPSAFSENDQNYTQDELGKQGIDSYLGRGNCASVTDTTTLQPTYDDLLNLGQIFHVEARATAMVKQMQAQIANVQQQLKGVKPLRMMDFEGGNTPLVAGGRGTAHTIIKLAGAKNVFDDVAKNFTETSWEEVVARDPQVIWIVPNSGGAGSCGTVKDIEQFLVSYRPIAQVTAIKERRFVVVYQNEGEFENASNADAVVTMAKALYPGKVK